MWRENAVLHVLRAHAVIGPDNRDNGYVDLGENIDRHAQRRADPCETDENQQRDHGIGPF